jgi:hydrogenase/urease accessory protein HupE
MKARLCAALALLAALASTRSARAHEFAPSVLDVRDLGGGRYEVIHKPAPGAPEGPASAAPTPVFPPHCAREPSGDSQATAATRWILACGPRGLAGQPIAFAGLSLGRGDALVRYTDAKGGTISAVLRADAPSLLVPDAASPAPPRLTVAKTYFGAGVEHLLTGWDHLLFVLGLVLLVPRARALVGAITAFTAAHSLSLALSITGVVKVHPAPAEAAIALSLLLLAGELARTQDEARAPTLARRHPAWMAFAFGLVHGLGFAGGLRELGLVPGQIPLALASFNVGIEAAQLVFVAVMLAIGRILVPLRASRGPAYVLGSVAWFLFLARVHRFWISD